MNKVKTKYGYFTACSDASDLRKKYRCPVEYHQNGNVRSIYLQDTEEVTLPEGLEVIGEYAFEDCHITSINFPSSLIEVGEHAFLNISLSGPVVVPGGVKTINAFAFPSSDTYQDPGH